MFLLTQTMALTMKRYLLSALTILVTLGNLQAADFYWRGDNGNWSDGTKWFDSPVGGSARNAVPTAADNVFFNANSFTLAGQTVAVDVAATCLTMNWTGATNTPTFTIANPLTISGELLFIPGMTVGGAGLVTFNGTGALNINMSGQTFGGATVFNNATGNWTLTGAFATAGALTLTAGALTTTGGVTVACGRFIHNTAQAVNLGTSVVTISGAGTGAGTSPFETTSAGTFTSAAATFNFTNTASVASEVRLGTTVRTYGNFIFAAPAATTKSIALIGAASHTLGAVTLGGNVSLTTPTNAYTYASLTAGASTEPAVLVSLGGNSTFTGLVNMGDNTGFQTATGSINSFAAVTIGASTLGGAGAVNFNGTNIYSGLVTLANNAIVSFNDIDTFNAGITGGNDVTTGFSLSGNAAAQTTFATGGTVAFGANLRGATAANIFSRRSITSSQPFTFGNNAGNGTALNWCENGGVINMSAAAAAVTLNRDARMNFKGAGNNVFQAITATDGGTGAGGRNLQFMNTGTLTFNGAQNLNSLGNLINVANTGTFTASGTFTTGPANSLTLASTVTSATFTGAVNIGATNTVNINNSLNTQFGGNLIFGNSTSPTRTNFIVSNNVDNFSVALTANFGNENDFTSNNAGTFTVGGVTAIGLNNTFTLNSAVTTATFNGQVDYSVGGGNTVITYNNSGAISFNNGVTTVGAVNTSLTVNFTNPAGTTYTNPVSLSATGTGVLNYRFSGGQTATINGDFSFTAACTSTINVTNTGASPANLSLSGALNRNWVGVTVSNLNASPANIVRAYSYVNAGGNTGIDFRNNSTANNRTYFWMAGGPQAGTNTLWNNLNNWSFEPDSYVPIGCLPTVADSVVFGHHDISFSPTNATVDVNGNYAVAGMRWSATDVTPANPILRSVGGATRTLTLAGAFDCYRAAGNVTFQNESATNRLNFTFTAARRVPANGFNDIRSGGVNFPREVIFNGNADNSRWRLISNFSARIDAGGNPTNNGSVYLQRGEWWCNGQDVVLGRFNARRYGAVDFLAPHRLEMDGDTDWTIQGRTGGLTGGSVPNDQVVDLQGDNFTFNTPSTDAYFYFTGASLDSTADTEGSWANFALGRSANVARTVPGISIGNRHNDIDINVDGQITAFVFRNLYLHPVALGFQRQIYIQTWNDDNTQLIFTGQVDFSNNTNQNPANDVGTVVRSSNRIPDATWSNVNRFERTVTIGNNSNITFWGNYRFMAPVNVAALAIVTFERSGGGASTYRFDANVSLGQAVIANFRSRVLWPVPNTALTIGTDAIAYVGNVPSSAVFPTEYVFGGNYNNWQNIELGTQGRLILNNGEGATPGPTITNDIVNLTFGEFSIVELSTELNTTNTPGTPRTRVTGTMSSSFLGVCSSWATLRSILEGKQADLIVNSAQTVNALVVKDVNVVENVAMIDVTINAGADAGNNSGANSLSFSGARTGRNFYWVGGTNKNKTANTYRRPSDTNYDGVVDDNGDNVNWSNPANWYTEPEASPVRTNLTAAMISADNQCVPTIIDNVYFINDGFIGGTNTGANVFVNRRNVLMDIPQGQAKNFIWNITAAAFAATGNAGAGFIASCAGANCNGPAVFTNEQQPILPTTEMQIAGNLQWSTPGAALSTGTAAAETVLRNNYISRFAFIGQGSSGSITTHTILSNGQRFAGEVFFDGRYSHWTPLDATDLNSHLQATSFPTPPGTAPGGNTAWSRASIIINQGALNMSEATPKRINLEGDWTISALFHWAQFDASTSEVVFDGSADGGANANNANINMAENIRVPAPNQPVNSPASDPNREYDPRRRRFYDLTVNKRQNDWDVRILNSPVTVLRNINITRGRLWDNDEGGSVPMQIKGKVGGTGTITMGAGTTLNLGTNNFPGFDNRFGDNTTVTWNWGTEFANTVNGYPTTFPLGYQKADIVLHENSNVIYWFHGHQNVSIVPNYGNLTLVNPNNAVTDFNTGYNALRKRHLINEPAITGNVTYGNYGPNSSTVPVPAISHGGTLTVKGSFDIQGGIDFLDNGNQVTFLTGAGANATRTLRVGQRGFLTLGSGTDATSLDASDRTLILANIATVFPANYTALDLDATSFVLYNAGVAQTVQGLSGAGNASYGHLMIANRSRADAPPFANKTLNAATTVRGQLRIYPNAHLIDNGNQIAMSATSRLMMLSTLPGTAATAPAANLNGDDLHDLRQLDANSRWTGATGPRGESRLSLGIAATATTFPTTVPNDQVFLQSRTSVVYNAGVAQSVRAFTDATDTTQVYANLVLVNPNASATAPISKTITLETGSGATAAAANATTGDATTNAFVKGDLIIAPNNSLVDNGYQINDPRALAGVFFQMPVLKATADAILPLGGRATLTGAGNTTGLNGVSKLILGTATIATDFPVNFVDVEINFEIAPNVSANLYSNVVYNSGRRQTIRALNDIAGATRNRTYGHVTLTNPSATPNGPVPKTLGGSIVVRGTITINPNNNLRTNDRTITPVVVAVSGTNSVPRLHMFSAVATATSAAAIVFNDQAAAINGPSVLTIGARADQNSSFPVFPAYNATHLNLELGTTVAYNHANSTSTVAAPANQNVQALANATDAQATYANLWFTAPENTLPNEVNSKTIVAGATGFTENRVRGSLVISPLANLVDNGIQIAATGSAAQDFRMFSTIANTQTYMNTGVPGTYTANAVFESIAYGSASTLYGAAAPGPAAAQDGTSALTLGNATTATLFPTFTGANGFVNANIDMADGTYVRYNAGVNQSIRSLFGATLTAGNNYANVELVNPAGSGTPTKTLLGQLRLRGNLMIGGRVASNRFNSGTITYQANGQANTLAVGTFNVNIQGNWVAFTSGNQATLSATMVGSGAANTINNIFNAGSATGTQRVIFEGGNAQTVISGTTAGAAPTVPNNFVNVELGKTPAASIANRTVSIRQDPMRVSRQANFLNGYFWSNVDGTESNATTAAGQFADDNVITFLDNAGTIMVEGPGTFPGAPGPNNLSYVRGAVRKIGRANVGFAGNGKMTGGAYPSTNAFDFPVGHPNGNFYAPMGVHTLLAGSDLTARYYPVSGNLSNNAGSLAPQPLPVTLPRPYNPGSFIAPLVFVNQSEFWALDGTTTVNFTGIGVKLSWDLTGATGNRTAGVAGLGADKLNIAHWKTASSAWVPEGKQDYFSAGFPDTQGVQWSAATVNHNGPFTNAEDGLTLLPIQLLSFEASQRGQEVDLVWRTAREINNDYFTIERSSDGFNFAPIIDRIPAKNGGNSNTTLSYGQVDRRPLVGKNFYRLKQTDKDGTFTYSKIVVVYFESDGTDKAGFSVYPNPVEGGQELNIVVFDKDFGPATLVIYDAIGREVHRVKVPETNLHTVIQYGDLRLKLSTGAYIVRVAGQSKTYTGRFVIN